MTLETIILSSLHQLNRDVSTIDTYREKMTRYANEAVTDLATVLQMRRTDMLEVKDGLTDIVFLPRCCVKVLYIARSMNRIPFISGGSSTSIRVLCDDGPVQVHYRYLPDDMKDRNDVPELPEFCHGLIVTYVVARDRSNADPSMQRGANVYFSLYNAGKHSLRAISGEANQYGYMDRR